MLEITIGVILIFVSVFLIVAVLMQSSKNARLSGAIAGGAETFFGKAKGKTIDKKLNKLTIIIAIVFAVIVLALYAIQPGKAKITFNYDVLDQYINGVKDGSIEITVSDDHDHDDEDEESAEDDSTGGSESDTEEGGSTEGGNDEGGNEGTGNEGSNDDETSNENPAA